MLIYITARRLSYFNISLGSVLGSLLGGRWSDRQLRRIREANNGKAYAEVSIRLDHYMILALTLYDYD